MDKARNRSIRLLLKNTTAGVIAVVAVIYLALNSTRFQEFAEWQRHLFIATTTLLSLASVNINLSNRNLDLATFEGLNKRYQRDRIRFYIKTADLTLLGFMILHEIGFTETALTFLLKVIPSVSEDMSQIITFAVVAAVSGVIGNLVYDLLKKALSAVVRG